VPLFEQPVFVRPGYRQWEAPDYLLPYAVIDDIGQEFEPPAVYEWLETRGDLYPRSDVIGYLPLGGERSIVVKGLDLTDLAVFASDRDRQSPFVRISLAIRTDPISDSFVVAPEPAPIPLVGRGLPTYRLSPGVFGAVGAAILNQLLASRRRDFRLTYDELDDMLGSGS
jgi:hypothetical protein